MIYVINKIFLGMTVLLLVSACNRSDPDQAQLVASQPRLRGSIVDCNGRVLAESVIVTNTNAESADTGQSETASSRLYPCGPLMAHVLGYVDKEGNARSGIEQSLDEVLRVTGEDDEETSGGATVMLTLDSRIQYHTEKVIERMCLDFNAGSGWAIVQKVKTGEILAMASFPTYEPIRYRKAPPEWIQNRSISFLYEPGSVMKAALISSALNQAVIREDDLIDCENGTWEYKGIRIHDSHAAGEITVSDVLKYSSNIGTAKIALKMGNERVYECLRSFQFGDRLGVGLPGEEAGILYSPDHWSESSVTRLGMGHEIAVTALQVVSMMSAIANDGIQMRPAVVKRVTAGDGTILQDFKPENIGGPLSIDIAHAMRKMLIGVTDNGGTGTKARVNGYKVGGMTGTVQKVRPQSEGGGYYTDRFIASFAGFLPADDPEIAIVVVADDPGVYTESGRKTQYYGGTVCAPVFSDIAGFCMNLLDDKLAQSMETEKQ